MSNRFSGGAACGFLLAAFFLQGCVNVVGSPKSEVVTGSPTVDNGEVQHTLVFSRPGDETLDPERMPISSPTISVSAVAIEPVTMTTPRNQRSTREVIPYRGTTELIEWPVTLLVGWVMVLEGNLGFGAYFDGLNPFMNSTQFNKHRDFETLGEVPMQPQIEERVRTRRVDADRISLRFPGLPPFEIDATTQNTSRVPLDRLVTRSLSAPPTVIEGQVYLRGAPEPILVRAELAPELSDRLFRASRRLDQMNAGDPADVATTMLALDELGFASRAQRIERSGIARHGAPKMSRAVADIYIEQARDAFEREDGEAALAAIELARAEVSMEPGDWDLLEADVHEAAGLEAIEAMDYGRARSSLLKASRLDRERQARLASFVAISIEAMDRETAREDNVANRTSPSLSAAAAPATHGNGTSSNLLEQCLSREAALQACRLMPGFGKDLCKSSVRANYSGLSCP